MIFDSHLHIIAARFPLIPNSGFRNKSCERRSSSSASPARSRPASSGNLVRSARSQHQSRIRSCMSTIGSCKGSGNALPSSSTGTVTGRGAESVLQYHHQSTGRKQGRATCSLDSSTSSSRGSGEEVTDPSRDNDSAAVLYRGSSGMADWTLKEGVHA